MAKITQFYLNKASYIAVDELGNQIDLQVNYWDKAFELSQENTELEEYAATLLSKKHRINFIAKMHTD